MTILEFAPLSFGPLLQGFRHQAGLTGTAAARAAGIDPSYLNRMERGEREPPGRELTLALARALALPAPDRDALLVAAGHFPEAIHRLGALDSTLLLVASLLADGRIPVAEQQEFRQIVQLVARRWRPEA